MSSNDEPDGDGLFPTRGRRDGFVDLFMTLQRTADRLMQGLEEALRRTGITPVQYLVLRSLREAGSAGMPSNQIARNMTTHDPDMTRLLDKLEERDVITRWRDKADRRVYRVKLTRDGAILLRELSQITRELHRKQFNTLDARQIKALTRTLSTVNDAPIPAKKKVDGDRRADKGKARVRLSPNT
ncbi:MAG TPA: MarR family transcriptional regulator [Tepidisphaeraceae bacterium]|jgi:DNA-binding MarR family transcriptional regulator